MKRKSTVEERAHMARVAAMGCVVCEVCYGIEGSPSQVHHVKERHGWGRSSHKATIPLCLEHHTGNTGIHTLGREGFEKRHGHSEIKLLEMVLDRMISHSREVA